MMPDADEDSGVGASGQPVACAPLARRWGELDDVLRLTYRTVGAGIRSGREELVIADAIVAIPAGATPPGGWPVVAWDHGTSGLGHDCGLTGSPDLEANTAAVIGRLRRAGFAVVAPDYLGLSPGSPGPHPYLHTSTEASATIDAVRAARIAVPDLGAAWAVAGESQGGHAALATGHRATRRAPELDFRGTVAVSPASNTESVFRMVTPGRRRIPLFPVGSFAATLAGMAAAQSDVDVASYLTDDGRRVLADIAETCSPGWDSVVEGLAPGRLVSRPLRGAEFTAALRSYMAVPTRGYDAPLLIVHGLRDVRVPLPLTLALLAQFTLHRTRFRFRLIDAGHNELLLDRGGIDIVLNELSALLGPATDPLKEPR